MVRFGIRSCLMAACATLVLASVPAGAAPIIGSMTLSSDGVQDNGLDFLARNVFMPDSLHVGLRTGNFMLVAAHSVISGGSLDLADLGNFGFVIAGIGAFADSGVTKVIGQRTASNLDVYMLGQFTPDPAGPLAAFSPSASSVRISLTRTGMDADFAVSFSGTEAAPPAPLPVPEPMSLALLGTGMLAAGLVRQRPHARVNQISA